MAEMGTMDRRLLHVVEKKIPLIGKISKGPLLRCVPNMKKTIQARGTRMVCALIFCIIG